MAPRVMSQRQRGRAPNEAMLEQPHEQSCLWRDSGHSYLTDPAHLITSSVTEVPNQQRNVCTSPNFSPAIPHNIKLEPLGRA